MQEHEFNGVHYRSGKLDAFKQFHVFRKLAPLLGGLFETIARTNEALQKARDSNGSLADAEVDAFSAVGPVARALADMPADDLNFVLNTCLAVCQRRNPQGSWVQIMPDAGGQMLFDDIDLTVMIKLTLGVVQDNLSNFFRDGLAGFLSQTGGLPLPSNGSG
jgi:hypothetical protein